MGMFDKDKEVGLRVDNEFPLIDRKNEDTAKPGESWAESEQFVMWAAELEPEKVDTGIGPADKTTMVVSRMETPDIRFDVSTLASAIADKTREADADDFPAVVKLLRVKSKKAGRQSALVLQYVRAYKEAQ